MTTELQITETATPAKARIHPAIIAQMDGEADILRLQALAASDPVAFGEECHRRAGRREDAKNAFCRTHSADDESAFEDARDACRRANLVEALRSLGPGLMLVTAEESANRTGRP